jgi:hypothetical protein
MPAYPAIALSDFSETASRIRRRSSANDQRFLTASAITLDPFAFGKGAREQGRKEGRAGRSEAAMKSLLPKITTAPEISAA